MGANERAKLSKNFQSTGPRCARCPDSNPRCRDQRYASVPRVLQSWPLDHQCVFFQWDRTYLRSVPGSNPHLPGKNRQCCR